MNFLVNLYTNATGIWKKVASWLPLISGAASVLIGLGNILLKVGHSQNAGDALNILKSLTPTDPNVMMIAGGLTALGIHSNHQDNVAAIDIHGNQLASVNTTLEVHSQRIDNKANK